MNVVDSSVWLEYFTDSPNRQIFEKVIENLEHLIVPSITIYEVFKKLMLLYDKATAVSYVSEMWEGTVVDLDAEIAMDAARLSVEHKLPMADSIILASANRFNATLWTQDEDFKNILGVKYFKKRKN